MSPALLRAWAGGVTEQLKTKADLLQDHFVFLAGDKYRKHLLPHIASYEIPLQGMPIGKQLQYLATHTHESNLP